MPAAPRDISEEDFREILAHLDKDSDGIVTKVRIRQPRTRARQPARIFLAARAVAHKPAAPARVSKRLLTRQPPW